MPRCISRTSPDVSPANEETYRDVPVARTALTLEARGEAPGERTAKIRTVGDDLEECRPFHRRTKLTANAFDFRAVLAWADPSCNPLTSRRCTGGECGQAPWFVLDLAETMTQPESLDTVGRFSDRAADYVR